MHQYHQLLSSCTYTTDNQINQTKSYFNNDIPVTGDHPDGVGYLSCCGGSGVSRGGSNFSTNFHSAVDSSIPAINLGLGFSKIL